MSEKKPIKLSGREQDVMEILWASPKAMIASEITKTNETLNINTVNAVLKSLMKKGMIEVADIVYSGTVLTRSYHPLITADEFALMFMENYYQKSNQTFSMSNLVASFLDHESNEEQVISELEQMLEERKAQLKK